MGCQCFESECIQAFLWKSGCMMQSSCPPQSSRRSRLSLKIPKSCHPMTSFLLQLQQVRRYRHQGCSAQNLSLASEFTLRVGAYTLMSAACCLSGSRRCMVERNPRDIFLNGHGTDSCSFQTLLLCQYVRACVCTPMLDLGKVERSSHDELLRHGTRKARRLDIYEISKKKNNVRNALLDKIKKMQLHKYLYIELAQIFTEFP